MYVWYEIHGVYGGEIVGIVYWMNLRPLSLSSHNRLSLYCWKSSPTIWHWNCWPQYHSEVRDWVEYCSNSLVNNLTVTWSKMDGYSVGHSCRSGGLGGWKETLMTNLHYCGIYTYECTVLYISHINSWILQMTLSFSEAAQLKTAILLGLTCPSITADLSQVNIDRKRYRPETVASGSGLYSIQDRGKLASKSKFFFLNSFTMSAYNYVNLQQYRLWFLPLSMKLYVFHRLSCELNSYKIPYLHWSLPSTPLFPPSSYPVYSIIFCAILCQYFSI